MRVPAVTPISLSMPDCECKNARPALASQYGSGRLATNAATSPVMRYDNSFAILSLP